MTAIVPMAPFEKQADSLAEQHRQARCNVRVNFDTAVFPADDSASRRCEMQSAIFLERVTRNRFALNRSVFSNVRRIAKPGNG